VREQNRVSAEEIEALGYRCAKLLLATGEWAALRQMNYTTGLFVGLTRIGYRTRFCYENGIVAAAALSVWDGSGDPPGPWIKQKPEDRLNPKWLAEARTELEGRPSVEHRRSREQPRRAAGIR
jgi:hypothetical protein